MSILDFNGWVKTLYRGAAVAFLLNAFWVGIVAADDVEPPRFDYGEIGGVFDMDDGRDGHLSFGNVGEAHAAYLDWKSGTIDRTGLSWLFEDRLISQWARNSDIFDNELNIIARYEFARQSPASWSLNLWGQFANTLGSRTQSGFQSDLGVLSPLNGGNSGPAKTNQILQMMALEYIDPSETLRFQVGKLAVRTLMNLNRYAHGDSESFFTPMLGNNPVVPYTALLGLGVFGQYRQDTWYASGLIRAPDTELGLSLDAWHSGAREYMVEVALTPYIASLGYGEYRLTWSRMENNGSLANAETLSLSADQDFSDKLSGFFRCAKANNTFRDFKSRTAAGLIVKKPFGFRHDRVGFGAWQGNPFNSALSKESGVEVFYKAQISPALEITPDVQFVLHPANSNRSTELILGVRLRLQL